MKCYEAFGPKRRKKTFCCILLNILYYINQERQHNTGERSRISCCEKQQYYTRVCLCVCVCILVLDIQHIKCLHRVMLQSVACLPPTYISTLSHIRHDIRAVYETTQNARIDFLYNFYLKHFSSKKNRVRYDHKCILVFIQHPLFLSDFNETCIF